MPQHRRVTARRDLALALLMERSALLVEAAAERDCWPVDPGRHRLDRREWAQAFIWNVQDKPSNAQN